MKKLLDVQKEIKAIKKEEDNPFFRSKYFDINGLLAALKPVLNKHGLIVIQPIGVTAEGLNTLNTIVIDGEDGKELVHGAMMLPTGLDPQKMGSAITYYRRYALQSLFLLESVDDDAEAATAPTRAKAVDASYYPPAAPKFSQGGKGDCPKCGSIMVMSKAGKPYCKALCWKKEPVTTPENDFSEY